MKEVNEWKNYIINIIAQIVFIIVSLALIIILYVNTNNSLVLNLYVLVPILEIYLYKVLKGKTDKKMLLSLFVENIVLILVFSIIFIPIILLINSNLELKIDAIKNLLLNRKIVLRMGEDIFTIIISFLLGFYIVYLIVKRNNRLNIKGVKLFSSNIKEKQVFKEKSIKVIKPYFIQNDAMNIDNAKNIDMLKVNLRFNETIKNYWDYLLNLKIIKKKNNQYYYDEKNENNIKETFKIWYSIIIGIIITILILFMNSFIFNLIINKKVNNISNNFLSFSIDFSWNIVKEDYSKNFWEFYKIIDDEIENKGNNSNKNIARILIEYDYKKDDEKNNESVESIKNTLEMYLANFYKKEDYRITSYISKKNCGIVEVGLKQNNYYEYDYYIYKNGKMAIISASINTNKESILEKLKKESKEIVETFYWK